MGIFFFGLTCLIMGRLVYDKSQGDFLITSNGFPQTGKIHQLHNFPIYKLWFNYGEAVNGLVSPVLHQFSFPNCGETPNQFTFLSYRELWGNFFFCLLYSFMRQLFISPLISSGLIIGKLCILFFPILFHGETLFLVLLLQPMPNWFIPQSWEFSSLA